LKIYWKLDEWLDFIPGVKRSWKSSDTFTRSIFY